MSENFEELFQIIPIMLYYVCGRLILNILVIIRKHHFEIIKYFLGRLEVANNKTICKYVKIIIESIFPVLSEEKPSSRHYIVGHGNLESCFTSGIGKNPSAATRTCVLFRKLLNASKHLKVVIRSQLIKSITQSYEKQR